MKYLRLMRIKHYIKNILIFVPLLFSGQFLKTKLFVNVLIGFFSFSLMSSVVYVFNDILDSEKDRMHPIKKKRPIASGEISIKKAVLFAAILCCVSLIFQIIFLNLKSTACLIVYLTLNYIYSKGLKNKPIIDIVILVSGFFIRVLYGAVIAEIAISTWLYLTVITGAFYMALGKRRNELKHIGNNSREVLEFYNYEFLDKNMYVCMGLLNTFYALWAATKGNDFLFTVPIVLIISVKYSFRIETKDNGDPVAIFLNDRFIAFLGVIYSIYVFMVLYMI